MRLKTCQICERLRRTGVWVTFWNYNDELMFGTEFWCQECVDLAVGMGLNIPPKWHVDVEPKTA